MKPVRLSRIAAGAIVILALLGSPGGAATPPGQINYQGVLRDSTNQPLDGDYPMTFRFVDAGFGDVILADEHASADGAGGVTVRGGLFNVQLGSGTVTDGAGPGTYNSLDEVFRDYDNVLLRVEINGETLSPDVRIVATAYAHNATNFSGLNSEQVLRSDVDDTMFGKAWFAGAPVSSSVAGGGVFISPNSAGADSTLLGIAVSGVEKLRVDAEGDAFVGGNMIVYGSSIGGYGISAAGSSGGAYVEDQDGTSYAYVGTATEGISAYGQTAGGYFADSDSSGHAYAGYGNRGVHALGTEMGAFFKDLDDSGHAIVGQGDRGILAYGTEYGGRFADSDGAGYAVLGIGNTGIQAYGEFPAGRFEDTSLGGVAFLGSGLNAVDGYSTSSFTGAIVGQSPDYTFGGLAKDGVSTYGSGTKEFIQNHPYDKSKVIRYKSLEGDEAGTYTRGTGRLSDGRVRVPLGRTFEWVTNPDIGLTAHLTARGAAADLYVESLSTTELVVQGAPGSDVVFDFIVFGLRIGFEEQSVVAEKDREAWIPGMQTERAIIAGDATLRGYTALARYERMESETLPGKNLERSRSEALRAAVGQYDPEVHGPVRRPDGSETPRQTVAAGRRIDRANRDPEAAADASAPKIPTVANDLPPMQPVSATVTPGDVLVLDPDEPGALRPGATIADPAVAGIALAGGSDEAPVAFSGLVRCKVDAGYGAIHVGDLLTASPTPGHAMRALEALPGTIVGKAVEPLEAGTGEIRVLVTLR